jgi:hypothetical protein
MGNWRLIVSLIAASVMLAASGAWLQEFLPRDTMLEVPLMWAGSLFLGYAVGLTHGSRAWLIASLVLLLAPFVGSRESLVGLLAGELRNRGLTRALIVPAIVTGILLLWPVIVLSFARWVGRSTREWAIARPDAWTPWRLPCAAACLLVFAGLQAFTFFPQHTTRRIGAWRTIQQRVEAAVAESTRLRARIGLADKAVLDFKDDYRVRAQLTPIEPVRFPFADRPTPISLVRLTPKPRFRIHFGAGREAEFDAETLICDYID